MQVLHTRIDRDTIHIEVEIPTEFVRQKYNEILENDRRTASVKGFRPGAAPLGVVEELLGGAARHQAFHDLVDLGMARAFFDLNEVVLLDGGAQAPLHTYGPGEHDHEISLGMPLKFFTVVKVIPPLELECLNGFSISSESEIGSPDFRNEIRNKLIQKILETNFFDINPNLINKQANVLAKGVAEHLLREGVAEEEVRQTLKLEEENMFHLAEMQVRGSLVLEAIFKQYSLEVSDEDLDEKMKSLAGEYGVTRDYLSSVILRNPEFMEEVKFKMRQEKALDFILSRIRPQGKSIV